MFWWIVGIAAVGFAAFYWVVPALMAVSFAAVFVWFSTLFVFGAPLFWLLMAIAGGLMFWAVEMASWLNESDFDHYDSNGNLLAFWTMVATFLLLQFFGDIKIFSYAFSSQWYFFLAYVVGYFLLGAVVSLPKLDVYTKKVLRPAYDKRRERFLAANDISGKVMPENLKAMWESALPSYLHLDVKHHKHRLICWMTVWPVTLFWLVFRDILLEVWDYIYDILSTVYQKILMRHFKDVADDFVKTPPPPAVPPEGNVSVDIEKHGYGARDPRLLPPDMHR